MKRCSLFPSGRVPSPSVNQLPSSDIEAMIQSVSNIPGGAVGASVQSIAAQRSKYCSKTEAFKLYIPCLRRLLYRGKLLS